MDQEPSLTRTMDGCNGQEAGIAGFERANDAHSLPNLRRLGSIDSEVLCLSTDQLAERVGIAVPTAREWRRLGRVPVMWLRAVRALVLGDLGAIDDAWRGWSIRSGALRSPDHGDYVFRTADVMSLPYTRQRLAEAQNELDLLRKPPPPPGPLTLESNWITSDWDERRYETDHDDEYARVERERREQWERTERTEREHRMLRMLWRR
jgi:hypothetical protein